MTEDRLGARLWVPASSREARVAHVCRLCGLEFAEGERAGWLRHLAQCASDQRDRLHAESPRTRLPFMWDPECGDPELEEAIKTRAVIKPDGSWTV